MAVHSAIFHTEPQMSTKWMCASSRRLGNAAAFILSSRTAEDIGIYIVWTINIKVQISVQVKATVRPLKLELKIHTTVT